VVTANVETREFHGSPVTPGLMRQRRLLMETLETIVNSIAQAMGYAMFGSYILGSALIVSAFLRGRGR
jgi:hypothetical protein